MNFPAPEDNKHFHDLLALWEKTDSTAFEFSPRSTSISEAIAFFRLSVAKTVYLVDQLSNLKDPAWKLDIYELSHRMLHPTNGIILCRLHDFMTIAAKGNPAANTIDEFEYEFKFLFKSLTHYSKGAFKKQLEIEAGSIPLFAKSLRDGNVELAKSLFNLTKNIFRSIYLLTSETFGNAYRQNTRKADPPRKLKKGCKSTDLPTAGVSFYENKKIFLKLKDSNGQSQSIPLSVSRHEFRKGSVGCRYEICGRTYCIPHKLAIAFIDCLIRENLTAQKKKDTEPEFTFVPILIKKDSTPSKARQGFTGSCFNDKDDEQHKKSKSFWHDMIETKVNKGTKAGEKVKADKMKQQLVRLKLPPN